MCRPTSGNYAEKAVSSQITGIKPSASPNDEPNARHSSFLLVLNAKDLSEIARAPLDTAIPYGLHGQFLGEHYSTL